MTDYIKRKYAVLGFAVVLIAVIMMVIVHHVSFWYSSTFDSQQARISIQAMGVALNTFLTVILVLGYIRMIDVQRDQQELMEKELIAVVEENSSSGSSEYGPDNQKIAYPQYNIELSNTGEGLARGLTVEYLVEYNQDKADLVLCSAKRPLQRMSGRGKSASGEGGVLKPDKTEDFRAPVELNLGKEDNPISIDTAVEELKSDGVDQVYLGFKIEYKSLSGEAGELFAQGRRIQTDGYDGFEDAMASSHKFQSSNLPQNGLVK
ncbi:hypothetical protein [Haloferax sulfurifontis]|uniref:Uncharacterized protein n=1 Tax=Haloferax sulfurifontis TaxID=255616 RepID=A0A830DQS2_9EURY|nr:hypothetical protein [Haloferax sulfurifontis]GGC52309.1 hypothetical protein GCM10007209_12470 [Haloferax sulfurifontis]